MAWFGFLIHALFWGIRLPGGAFLLVVTNPPLLPHLAWILHRARGIPYGLLVWDIYPDHLVALDLIPHSHPLARMWRTLNRKAMKDARVVITLGEAMAETLRGQLLSRRPLDKPIEVIPNWADVDHIRPLPKCSNSFARAHGQIGKVTVMYAGNVGATHGLEILASTAEALKNDSRISFMVVGDGLGLDGLVKEAEARRLTNIEFLPPQPWSALPEMLATADIAVVAQRAGTEALSMPSKAYSSLAAGSALLALTSRQGDLARLVIDHRVGLVSPQGDVAGLVGCLRRLTDGEAELREMRLIARRVAVEIFSGEHAYRLLRASLTPVSRPAKPPGT